MAIKGSLREAGLPDVIQLLSMGQKTGILTVTEKEHFGSISFFKGNIVDSYLITRKNRIGELLVASGEMSEEQLAEALELQKKTGEKIGKILLKEKFVREESLVTYLKQQIQETIMTMMTWENGYFSFEPRFTDMDEELVAVNPANLLLETAKQADELSEVSLDILRESSIVKPVASDEEIEQLTKNEKRVYSLIDGEKTLEIIIEFSPFDTFDTKGIVSSFVNRGYCQVIERISPQGISEKINEHLNLGIAFLKTQLYDEAEREFKHVVKLNPKNRDARFYLSVILTKTKNYREAEELLRKLLKEHPDNSLYQNNLGYILEVKNRLDEAMECFEKSSGLEISGIPVLNKGIVLFKRGDFAPAKEHFERALGIDKNLLLPHFYLGMINIVAGKPTDTIQEFEFIIEKDPTIPTIYFNLGIIYENLMKSEKAEESYKKALELAPNYMEAKIKLGGLYYKQGLYPSAQKIFEIISGVGLGNADMFLKLGNIYYKIGQKDRALKQWKKTLEFDPGNKIARRNIEMAG